MNIKLRLTLLNFFQFFVWGAWLITIANYWFGTKQWDGTKFGAVFSTMGFASIFMPTLSGIIADRWINAERLYGILQILYAAVLFFSAPSNRSRNFLLGNAYSNVLLHANDCSEQFYILYRFKK